MKIPTNKNHLGWDNFDPDFTVTYYDPGGIGNQGWEVKLENWEKVTIMSLIEFLSNTTVVRSITDQVPQSSQIYTGIASSATTCRITFKGISMGSPVTKIITRFLSLS